MNRLSLPHTFIPSCFTFILILLASYFVLHASIASAQTIPTTANGLDLSASTDSPEPGQDVTITATSYTIDINSAMMTWVVGGKVVAHAVGTTSEIVEAPALGKSLVISATAVSPDGTAVSDSLTLGSGSVDMIIEPSGYVPPFFMGKNAVSYQNNVNIVAMPHLANAAGTEYDPKTLVYQWTQDNSPLPDQSGYGKQSLTIQESSIPRSTMIGVTASTRDGSAQSDGLIEVDAGAPGVVLYTDDPLYGPLYNKALGPDIYMGSQRELGIIAVPYGFDVTNNDPSSLSLGWSINGADDPDLDGNDTITLRAPDGSSGSSDVELGVGSASNILQTASAEFTAFFSASTQASQQAVTF